MSLKYRLFAPGPTPIPESVRLAMAQPAMHHRTAEFAQVFDDVRQNLRWLFQTQQEVLCFAGSGTLAMEIAVSNFLSPGDLALYVQAGKFGARWGDILRAFHIEAHEITVPWGQAVTLAAVEAAIRQHPNARALYVQACETSTAVQHPVAEIAHICAKYENLLCVVDGITSVGIDDISLDRDNLDILLSASQKALMLPPGLAFLSMSNKAYRRAQVAQLPKFYVNVLEAQQAATHNQTVWTPATSLLLGLQQSLKLLRQEGLPQIFTRHRLAAAACQAGLQAMGFELYAQTKADGVTAAYPPKGVNAEALRAYLQTRYNMFVAGGQASLQGHIIRISHMGYFDELDLLSVLAALDAACAHFMGAKATKGAGVLAAQAVFAALDS